LFSLALEASGKEENFPVSVSNVAWPLCCPGCAGWLLKKKKSSVPV